MEIYPTLELSPDRNAYQSCESRFQVVQSWTCNAINKILIGTMLTIVPPSTTVLYTHEPVFGLEPHTIFSGGIGVETAIETETGAHAAFVEDSGYLRLEALSPGSAV